MCEYEIVGKKIMIYDFGKSDNHQNLIESIIQKCDATIIDFYAYCDDLTNIVKNTPKKINELHFGSVMIKCQLTFPTHIKKIIICDCYAGHFDNLPPNIDSLVFCNAHNNGFNVRFNKKIDNFPISMKTLIFNVEDYEHSFDLLPLNLDIFLLKIPSSNWDFTKIANLPPNIKIFGLSCDNSESKYDCTQFKYFPPKLEIFVTDIYCVFEWVALPTCVKYIYIIISDFDSNKNISTHFSNIVETLRDTQLCEVFYGYPRTYPRYFHNIFRKINGVWESIQGVSRFEFEKHICNIGLDKDNVRYLSL